MAEKFFEEFFNDQDLSEDVARFFDHMENATISELRDISDKFSVTIKVSLSHGGLDIAFEKEKEIQNEQCCIEREDPAQ